MAIELLIIPVWTGGGKEDREIHNPTWSDVEAAICALNNEDLNDVYLQPVAADTDTWLVIGGGAGRYIVTGAENNRRFPILFDQTKSETMEELVTGGQTGDFPGTQIHSLAEILGPVRDFYETGGFHGTTRWTGV